MRPILALLLLSAAAHAQTSPGQIPAWGVVGNPSTSVTTAPSAATLPTMLGGPPLIPGLTSNVAGTGMPGMDLPACTSASTCGWMIRQAPSTTAGAVIPALRLQREASYTGGTIGTTVQSLFALTFTSPDSAYFEWPITSQLINRTEATTGAQNVAINGTVQKINAPGRTAEIGPTWAGNFNCVDSTHRVNPTHSCLGMEIDTQATADAGTDVFRQRVALQLAWTSIDGTGGSGLHFGTGMLLGGNDASTMDHGIFYSGSGGYQIGINFANASFSKAPLFLAPSQRIVLDGGPTSTITQGDFTRSLFYFNNFLTYQTANGNVVNIDDLGNYFTGGSGFSRSFVSVGAAIVANSGQISYGGTTVAPNTATCPTGTIGGSTLIGCVVINVNGNTRYLPYF